MTHLVVSELGPCMEGNKALAAVLVGGACPKLRLLGTSWHDSKDDDDHEEEEEEEDEVDEVDDDSDNDDSFVDKKDISHTRKKLVEGIYISLNF